MKDKIGKIINNKNKKNAKLEIKRHNIKITKDGVFFFVEGKAKFLGPKLSMKIQKKLGADIIFAFDECTSPLDNFEYNKKALGRTHKWAMECLELKPNNQELFGIVQGGIYKSLRIKSAKFIGSLPFDGFGIGGSFGENEMHKTLGWIIPYLPEEKPRHLLGIGTIKDIFIAVQNGVDLFDCVIPTREGRHGRIWTRRGHYDIRKNKYLKSKKRLELRCKCPSCNKINQKILHRLFKGQSQNDKAKAMRYATMHNMWFFNTLLSDIRKSIKKDNFLDFKNSIIQN